MYLTLGEYVIITDRPAAEATDARVKRASLLLDARIGNHVPGKDGWKLDLEALTAAEKSAVQEWVAQMVAYLCENGDVGPSSANLRLGRFGVSRYAGQGAGVLPEELRLADGILVGSGLVRRRVSTV